MGDEDGVPREVEKAAHRLHRSRCASQVLVAEPRDRRGAGRDPEPRIDKRLELLRLLESPDPDGPDLADGGRPWPQPRCLEVDDDVGRLLEEQLAAGRLRERDSVAVPGQSRIGLDHLRQERAREGNRSLAQREQPPRCVLGRDRRAFLDKFHESVGRV